MDIEKTPTNVTEKDIDFLEQNLKKSSRPILLTDLAKTLIFHKSAAQLRQEVKKYDPYCLYEINDLIYKEYNESLTVSSKGVEHFKGAVILKVINKVNYENFNCEVLEVDYSGGGIFRKYIDYMKKTKTQVLLPSNLEGKTNIPEKMKKQEDPRLNQLPMTDRDFKTLEKKLRTALSKSTTFFNWNEYWQLVKNQVEISEEKIEKIKNFILETKESIETAFGVKKFWGLDESDDLFAMYCLSLNHALEKKHKKDFVYVSPLGWGKWHLKKILESSLNDLPISAASVKLPLIEKEEKRQRAQMQTSSIKVYLSWREILSGGIKISKALNKELSSCREYIFIDVEEEKEYTFYFYPSHGFFLGLKDFYIQNNVPQGASLTLEKKGINTFSFWLKKSKKKLSVFKVTYDPKEDKFRDTGEELFTFALPNKIIHLEKETFARLYSLYSLRNDLNLRELLIHIFKNFGVEAENFSLHYLRAYHLVDVLKLTSLEDVEQTLINSPEFIKSDKKKGFFSLLEKREVEEEAVPEALGEVQPEASPEEEVPSEILHKEIPTEEIPLVTQEIEKEEKLPEIQEVEVEREAVGEKPPKKIKIQKRKKLKMEGEVAPRLRKREKRFIEEKIEIEELEQEAITAIKEKKEEERDEVRAKEKKEEFEKPLAQEEPVFGLFAEKLKSALDKKKKEKKK
ncbi:MAG: hypothetical protein ACETWK_12130 [Candidatus Aminicenantaceae bacterium]